MREVQDHYFRLARQQGYLSRAAFKLIEIDDRRKLLRTGDCVLDCGAAPGSWTQVALKRIGPRGRIVAIDLQPIKVPNDNRLTMLTGDFTKLSAAELTQPPPGSDPVRFDVVLSDLAPSTTGDRLIDHYASIRLCESVLDRLDELLRIGGRLTIKVFEGEAYPPLLERVKGMFSQVKGFRPKASRSESTEMFIIAEYFHRPAGGASGA